MRTIFRNEVRFLSARRVMLILSTDDLRAV